MLNKIIFKDVLNDLQKVEKEINKYVETPNDVLTETSRHLLLAGGKRLRPAFAILAGKLYGCTLEKLMPLAVALEIIHMASLVHDDVVDKSYTRRGELTVKAKWGDDISLHTGDYLFGKSLILISEYEDKRVSQVLASVSTKMCQGEIQQLATAYEINQDLRDYFYRINRKTALLISASTQLGAIVAGAPQKGIRALKFYGHYLGMAFQITDDILDMTASVEKLGKPIGSDLRQGIITLPAIYALQYSCQKDKLKELLAKKDKTEKEVLKCIDIIKESGGIEYSFNITRKYIKKAKEELEKLPQVRETNIFNKAADLIYERSY